MFSGEEGTTDNSILYDYDGIPFVSGTTLAGAFRNYYNLEKRVLLWTKQQRENLMQILRQLIEI